LATLSRLVEAEMARKKTKKRLYVLEFPTGSRIYNDEGKKKKQEEPTRNGAETEQSESGEELWTFLNR
jgi:hypothetical protein